MEVLLVTPDGAEHRTEDELDELLDKARSGHGIVWVDVPSWCDPAAEALVERFGIHPRAVGDCERRNPVPKVHLYNEHLFVVLHSPERGERGHVHYVELDQFVGPGWLITVHGPVNPKVSADSTAVETTAVARRMVNGRLRPGTSHELSYALVSAMVSRMRDYLAALTEEVWALEKQVTAGHLGQIEEFLEQLFQVRHGLLTVRTMAALGDGAHTLVVDLEDQFRRIAQMADAQREYLQGVIEFYQTRTNTKMTVAAERLAVIAAVTLPITALSGIMGMNVIVNAATDFVWLTVLLVVMAAMSVVMLIWARRQGWW